MAHFAGHACPCMVYSHGSTSPRAWEDKPGLLKLDHRSIQARR